MRTVGEMIASMGHVIRENKMDELRLSPSYSSCSLLIDETTDVAIMKQLIIYGRYMSKCNQVI